MIFVQAFRKTDRDFLRQPMRYIPLATEVKGIANLAIGSLQMVTWQLMRCSSKEYYKKLADRHFEIGMQSLSMGARECFPAAAIMTGYYLFRGS